MKVGSECLYIVCIFSGTKSVGFKSLVFLTVLSCCYSNSIFAMVLVYIHYMHKNMVDSVNLLLKLYCLIELYYTRKISNTFAM